MGIFHVDGINSIETRHDTMAKSQRPALQKHIRILPEQWERLEAASAGAPRTSNQLLVELAMDALDRRESLSGEARIKVARASLFAA